MASTSKVLNDQANGARLSRLLVNKGTQALRAALDTHVRHLPSTLAAELNTNKAILQKLRYKVINTSQWKLLYPSSGTPDSKTFDVTLLTVLLRNICGLAPPASGSWDALPPDSDNSIAASIARIKFYRNHVHAHITTTEITDNEFEDLWLKISKALIALGIAEADLDQLKEAPLSPEEADCIDLLGDWCKREAELDADAKETLAILKQYAFQNFRESEKVPVVKKLCKCDFNGIRESLNKKFLPGTRQWLFDKLSAWFDDKNSQSNVMILTAGPGVGKSVFAAEVCRIYDEKGQMAACHFSQYNKSDYSNPRMIIESLASNMCDKVEGFKAELDDQLQRNHSRETLSDAFRVLLNDPLHALKNSKPMLFVIDALDESAVAGKSEFLELISEEFPKLPQWIKILITSRPELPVKEKLKHLNPVEITPHDTENEKDLLKYIRESLSHICKNNFVFTSLSRECEGSFLFAYYTQLELKETTQQLTMENIYELVPKGISGFYKKQFKHLENQLSNFGSSRIKLKRFLQILVAAEGPLPLSFLPECLELPDDIEYEVRESIIGIMSSILPVYENCWTIYHKSLRDWLMSDGYEQHAFTVDSHTGHEYLWKVCKKEFDQLIPFSKPSPMTKYALVHGISHMIKSASKSSYHLSVDVKIVHARMTSKIDEDQMIHEWCEIVEYSLSGLTSEVLYELNWHIDLFTFKRLFINTTNPAFYLRWVANRIDCGSDTRLLARSLLEQGHHFWFEYLDATNLQNYSYKSVFLRAPVMCMCVSPNQQLLAAGCEDGWISIFRVPEFHKVSTFDTMPDCPDLNSPLFVQLQSCSFSPSSVRLVTCDGSDKVRLWDVNNGNLLAQLQAGGSVDYCFFSESGLFIVADKERETNNWEWQRDLCSDVFAVWNALTLQRIDRRIIQQEKVDPARSDASFWYWFPPIKNFDKEFLLSFDDCCLNVFQLPNALLAARSYKPDLQNLPRRNLIRHHWRFCVLHHINVLIKLTVSEEDQRVYSGICPCELQHYRSGPVTVQNLYVVPSLSKLNIFNVADQSSLSIQPSFVSESYVISCCCFSPDGSFLATCANVHSHSVLIWDIKLCTVIQVVEFTLATARGCWWSDNLLWIYDNGLVKIPISNGRTLDPSGAQRLKIDFKPRKLLTFADVLIFIDQEYSVNVARIKNGELQYVEKLPVNDRILCAAVSPCNSIIFMVSSKLTVHVWKENQTSQSRHWVSSNTGEVLDFSHLKEGELEIDSCKCCIARNSTKGVLLLTFCSNEIKGYLIFVDLHAPRSKIRKLHGWYYKFCRLIEIYAGSSYCVFVYNDFHWLEAVKLTTGEYVAEWGTSDINNCAISRKLIAAHSRNDIVAVILQSPAGVCFLKMSIPE